MKKSTVLILVMILSMLMNMVFPYPVLADDGAPPAATEEVEAQAEITDTPQETEVSVDEVQENAPAAEPTSEPVEEAVVELSEVVQEMQSAGVILADGNGNPIPLATEVAEGALLAPDPIGCPPGVEPVTWGGTGIGCTISYASIQGAINDVSVVAGWTIYIDPGTFYENVNVNKSVTLQGSGVGVTIVRPSATSSVDLGCGAGSCAGVGNTVFYVTADNVTIRDLTINGDNDLVASGTVVNGVDLNARNGIYGNDADYLVVEDTEVRNVYLRGIQVVVSDSVEIRNNTINNVDGSEYSISIFNYTSGGVIEGNTISQTGDGIASNWSTGVHILNNTISDMGTGIHTDNTGGVDMISGNTISNGRPNSYGVFVFAPYNPVMVSNNTITNVDIGLTVSGNGFGDTPNTITFENNTVTTNVAGAYVTTDVWGYFFSDVNAQFNNNIFTGGDYGFVFESNGAGENIGGAAGYSYDCSGAGGDCILNVSGTGNSITGQNLFAAFVSMGQPAWFTASPVFYGIYNVDLSGNWWGDASGPEDIDTVASGCDNSNALTNPSGLGGEVSECIIYDPYLTADPFLTPTPTTPSTPTPPATGGSDENGSKTSPPALSYGMGAGCGDGDRVIAVGEIKITVSGLCEYQVVAEPVILDEAASVLAGNDSKGMYPEFKSLLDNGKKLLYGVSIAVYKDGVPVQTLPAGASMTISFPTDEGTVFKWVGSCSYKPEDATFWAGLCPTTGDSGAEWSGSWNELNSTLVDERLEVQTGLSFSMQGGPGIYILVGE